jgi:hypothetical protein
MAVEIGLNAFAAIHEQPLPLPDYCGIGYLSSAA